MSELNLTKEQAIELYGSPIRLAEALGITRQAVHQWREDRPIPQKHTYRLYYEIKPKGLK